ncbi:wall-associated kinase family protein [Artemisia annua]|uniref:Wall-associated kinase family protein n=1 Tax=Artemisia annua TaxID=35608 RepID=A0A2U1NF49_ARTAN|nr:wall-associated kinase family protein [Artemisia annua]
MKLFQAYIFFLLVILRSSTTLGSVPKYSKTGCEDTCGNVRIPFPFGIGANCSVSKWYNVDCNSSTPYLSSLNQLEVLRVDLQDRTVTVKMQKFSNCSQTTKSVDLGSSPFLYSKSHNTFIYEGYCGNAVMMDNHGSVLTGCSTTCSNDTTKTAAGIIGTSTCFGINCCQSKIPQYLESYSMNLTGMEKQMGGDGVCGSAYLLNTNSYAEGSISYVPTSLQWILSDRDQDQVSCIGEWDSDVMDLGNGTLMNSWYCYYPPTIKGNPYLIDGYDRWELLGLLVVSSKMVDPVFKKNQPEFGVLVLPVPLQMLPDSHSLLDEVIQIL